MGPDGMAFGDGLPDEFGVLKSGTADKEESRNDPVPGQDVKDGRGELGVWAVVKGDRDRPSTGREAPIDTTDTLSQPTSATPVNAVDALQHAGMVVAVEEKANAR
jgi:hypothetical protein